MGGRDGLENLNSACNALVANARKKIRNHGEKAPGAKRRKSWSDGGSFKGKVEGSGHQQDPQQGRFSMREEMYQSLRLIWEGITFGCIIYTIHTYVVDLTMCIGPSMRPTLNGTGDIVLVENITPLLHMLRPGQIVIAKSPSKPGLTVCKRIVGMEGDIVHPSKKYPSEKRKPVRVPKGKVWLEGDNPYDSTDSRDYGPVSMNLIKGRVIWKLWPIMEMGPLK